MYIKIKELKYVHKLYKVLNLLNYMDGKLPLSISYKHLGSKKLEIILNYHLGKV